MYINIVTGNRTFDLAIVGGGINGAGIACDAAGRGLSVVLVEGAGLAGATSSASSKLIHGGLRYLEQREFRLVRKALAEREILLSKAPHIVRPLHFVMPHAVGLRPRWMIGLGLLLYDHLSRRKRIPGSGALDLHDSPAGRPLRDSYRHGYAYWDCWVDDARLVVLNARAAADRGADVRTWTRLVGARTEAGLWRLDLRDVLSGATDAVRARAVVNAAGPWVDSVAEACHANPSNGDEIKIRRIKGSHLVVRRIPGADEAYILQQPDGRVVFVLPFENDYSLIGTTDVSFEGDPRDLDVDDAETDYLLSAVDRFFSPSPNRHDIVWSYAGVRPLLDDDAASAHAITRDYRLAMSAPNGGPPLLSVIGGKITTYRCLAEEALEMLGPTFPGLGHAWTANSLLPGGDIPDDDLAAFAQSLRTRHAGLQPEIVEGIARRHGTLAEAVLGGARREDDLGREIGAGLYEREVAYLRDNEWARTADDVLWRHTKAGLHLAPEAYDRAVERIEELM